MTSTARPNLTTTRKKFVTVVGLTLATLLSLSALTNVKTSWAQIKDPEPVEQVGLAAIPPRAGENGELKAAPGEVVQTTIKVRNISDKAVTIHSVAQDFIIGEDGETPVPVIDQVSQRWSLASWVTVSPEYQDLAPNQVGQLNVLVKVPDDALPGGHYAMVTHQPSNGKPETTVEVTTQDSSAIVNQKVGTLFYVMVDGPINEEAFIRDFQIPKFTEFGPVPFSLSIDNQSDIHIRPRITVDISNIFGQTVDSIQLEEKNVFPLSSRSYQGAWDRIWGIGLYKATVSMSFGNSGQVVTSHQMFWLFPITLLWVALVIILVAIVLTIAIRRHLQHRKTQDHQRVEMLEQRLAELEKERSERNSK